MLATLAHSAAVLVAQVSHLIAAILVVPANMEPPF
jgi:hypothetical protein